MDEIRKHGHVGRAALRAGMDRKTASKYLKLGKLPSEAKKSRTWRTRSDPFQEDWSWIEERLRAAPRLQAKTIFEALQDKWPGRYQQGQLRTLQRRLKRWRAKHGPEREVFFVQEHRPGEAMQTDFTEATSLQVTIQGERLEHLLCHAVLPYSNWEWATVAFSESYLALKRGMQEALFRLERHPEWHQTDNTSAATHKPRKGKRVFNDNYRQLVEHFGMKPRTTAIGAKEQNGDIEASNGGLKDWLDQQLLLRGSRDFESEAAWEHWLWAMLDKRNARRQERLEHDLAAMQPLRAPRLGDFRELEVRVTSWSTIRVLLNTYSVPSRLIGERVRVRVFERRLEVWYAGERELDVARLHGRHGHRINYRHIIWSLVRKPGAFARYRYRDDLFPSAVFRRAHEELYAAQPSVRGDLEYLRILHLAAATMESEVEVALECLLDGGELSADNVKDLIGADKPPEPPDMAAFEVELDLYDDLFADDSEVAS